MTAAIKQTKDMGRGVFAQKDMPAKFVIFKNPVVVSDSWEASALSNTVFNKYVFGWTHGASAIALGLGSLINHSKEPNVDVVFDIEAQEIIFYATRFIGEGEQLFIDYGYDPNRGEFLYEASKANSTEKAKSDLQKETEQFLSQPPRFTI